MSKWKHPAILIVAYYQKCLVTLSGFWQLRDGGEGLRESVKKKNLGFFSDVV